MIGKGAKGRDHLLTVGLCLYRRRALDGGVRNDEAVNPKPQGQSRNVSLLLLCQIRRHLLIH